MTRIEANKLMDACHDAACHDVNTEITNYLLDEAYAALNKQVPMKLKHEKYADDFFSPDEEYWLCPRCEADVTENAAFWEYCPMCGQRLNHDT